MADKKISCGGFYIDDKTLSLSDDNKLSVKGGSSGGGDVLVVSDTNGTLDKTWQEMHDAPVVVIYEENGLRSFLFATIVSEINGYSCIFITLGGNGLESVTYSAESAEEYPRLPY